jgi:ribosome-associated protein
MADELPITERILVPAQALRVQYSRSGGPGGQNVNTRATKVQLFLNLAISGLHPAVKERLANAHPGKLSAAGEIMVSVSTHRTQDANLSTARKRLVDMIQQVLQPPKRRRKTRPTRGSKERRLKGKAQRSETKKSRGKVDY